MSLGLLLDSHSIASKRILYGPILTGGNESALVAEEEKRGFQPIVMSGRRIKGTILTVLYIRLSEPIN